jgi:hypothetical protein
MLCVCRLCLLTICSSKAEARLACINQLSGWPLLLLLLQVHVPAGQQVMSFLYGYQRDPEYWPAALEFRPERWLPVRTAAHAVCVRQE